MVKDLQICHSQQWLHAWRDLRRAGTAEPDLRHPHATHRGIIEADSLSRNEARGAAAEAMEAQLLAAQPWQWPVGSLAQRRDGLREP